MESPKSQTEGKNEEIEIIEHNESQPNILSSPIKPSHTSVAGHVKAAKSSSDKPNHFSHQIDISKFDNASVNKTNIENIAQNEKFREIFEELDRGGSSLDLRFGLSSPLSEFTNCYSKKDKFEMLQKMLKRTFGPFLNQELLPKTNNSTLNRSHVPTRSKFGDTSVREKLEDVQNELGVLKTSLIESRRQHQENSISLKVENPHYYKSTKHQDLLNDLSSGLKSGSADHSMSVYYSRFLVKDRNIKNNFYTKVLESEIRSKETNTLLDSSIKKMFPFEKSKSSWSLNDQPNQKYLKALIQDLRSKKRNILVTQSSYSSLLF